MKNFKILMFFVLFLNSLLFVSAGNLFNNSQITGTINEYNYLESTEYFNLANYEGIVSNPTTEIYDLINSMYFSDERENLNSKVELSYQLLDDFLTQNEVIEKKYLKYTLKYPYKINGEREEKTIECNLLSPLFQNKLFNITNETISTEKNNETLSSLFVETYEDECLNFLNNKSIKSVNDNGYIINDIYFNDKLVGTISFTDFDLDNKVDEELKSIINRIYSTNGKLILSSLSTEPLRELNYQIGLNERMYDYLTNSSLQNQYGNTYFTSEDSKYILNSMLGLNIDYNNLNSSDDNFYGVPNKYLIGSNLKKETYLKEKIDLMNDFSDAVKNVNLFEEEKISESGERLYNFYNFNKNNEDSSIDLINDFTYFSCTDTKNFINELYYTDFNELLENRYGLSNSELYNIVDSYCRKNKPKDVSEYYFNERKFTNDLKFEINKIDTDNELEISNLKYDYYTFEEKDSNNLYNQIGEYLGINDEYKMKDIVGVKKETEVFTQDDINIYIQQKNLNSLINILDTINFVNGNKQTNNISVNYYYSNSKIFPYNQLYYYDSENYYFKNYAIVKDQNNESITVLTGDFNSNIIGNDEIKEKVADNELYTFKTSLLSLNLLNNIYTNSEYLSSQTKEEFLIKRNANFFSYFDDEIDTFKHFILTERSEYYDKTKEGWFFYDLNPKYDLFKIEGENLDQRSYFDIMVFNPEIEYKSDQFSETDNENEKIQDENLIYFIDNKLYFGIYGYSIFNSELITQNNTWKSLSSLSNDFLPICMTNNEEKRNSDGSEILTESRYQDDCTDDGPKRCDGTSSENPYRGEELSDCNIGYNKGIKEIARLKEPTSEDIYIEVYTDGNRLIDSKKITTINFENLNLYVGNSITPDQFQDKLDLIEEKNEKIQEFFEESNNVLNKNNYNIFFSKFCEDGTCSTSEINNILNFDLSDENDNTEFIFKLKTVVNTKEYVFIPYLKIEEYEEEYHTHSEQKRFKECDEDGDCKRWYEVVEEDVEESSRVSDYDYDEISDQRKYYVNETKLSFETYYTTGKELSINFKNKKINENKIPVNFNLTGDYTDGNKIYSNSNYELELSDFTDFNGEIKLYQNNNEITELFNVKTINPLYLSMYKFDVFNDDSFFSFLQNIDQTLMDRYSTTVLKFINQFICDDITRTINYKNETYEITTTNPYCEISYFDKTNDMIFTRLSHDEVIIDNKKTIESSYNQMVNDLNEEKLTDLIDRGITFSDLYGDTNQYKDYLNRVSLDFNVINNEDTRKGDDTDYYNDIVNLGYTSDMDFSELTTNTKYLEIDGKTLNYDFNKYGKMTKEELTTLLNDMVNEIDEDTDITDTNLFIQNYFSTLKIDIPSRGFDTINEELYLDFITNSGDKTLRLYLTCNADMVQTDSIISQQSEKCIDLKQFVEITDSLKYEFFNIITENDTQYVEIKNNYEHLNLEIYLKNNNIFSEDEWVLLQTTNNENDLIELPESLKSEIKIVINDPRYYKEEYTLEKSKFSFDILSLFLTYYFYPIFFILVVYLIESLKSSNRLKEKPISKSMMNTYTRIFFGFKYNYDDPRSFIIGFIFSTLLLNLFDNILYSAFLIISMCIIVYYVLNGKSFKDFTISNSKSKTSFLKGNIAVLYFVFVYQLYLIFGLEFISFVFILYTLYAIFMILYAIFKTYSDE